VVNYLEQTLAACRAGQSIPDLIPTGA
jgi:hypothetical protein